MLAKDPAQIALLVQRLAGFAALGFLVIRVIWKRWGILVWVFILIHIASYVFFVYKVKGFFDPFYPFTDLCLLCKNVIYPEYFVNFGRIALWLLGFGVLAKIVGLKKFYFLPFLALAFVLLHILTLR